MSEGLAAPHDPSRNLRLENAGCVYCVKPFTPQNPGTLEHVVGRRFVPVGTLSGCWNLLLRACRSCNADKALLEGEVAALTMQPNAAGVFPDDGLRLQDEAERRERVRSSATKKWVSESTERQTISGSPMPGVTFTASIVSPPRLDEEVVLSLARFQISAFFFFVTYSQAARMGSATPGAFALAQHARRSDWGNECIVHFAQTTRDWLTRFVGVTADGYFRVAIRRDPNLQDVWSWALEWNRGHRVIGFFGDEALVREAYDALPELRWNRVDAVTRVRRERPLCDQEDVLFLL